MVIILKAQEVTPLNSQSSVRTLDKGERVPTKCEVSLLFSSRLTDYTTCMAVVGLCVNIFNWSLGF